jgi:hypothetical protein
MPSPIFKGLRGVANPEPLKCCTSIDSDCNCYEDTALRFILISPTVLISISCHFLGFPMSLQIDYNPNLHYLSPVVIAFSYHHRVPKECFRDSLG